MREACAEEPNTGTTTAARAYHDASRKPDRVMGQS
jgi:hypothetical protein